MPLIEEGIEGSSEAIVRDLFERHQKEEIGERPLGPPGDVAQRDGFMGASGDEQTENGSVRKLGLLIDGNVLIDDVSDAHAFEKRHNDREPSERGTFDIGVFSVTNSVHERSLARLGK